MPRSAADATRFTSTTPHASAIPPSAANLQSHSSLQQQQKQRKAVPGPLGETPLEKVKRLRAAADRARDAQISTFDKLIVRGRVWADFAHRATTLFLIGTTVVAAGVTVYALGDMMIYNRKKRAQFFEEQKAIHQNAVHKAKQSIEAGFASEADVEFVKREKEHDELLAEIAKKKATKKGIFKRGKEWLFSGLKKDEEGSEGEEDRENRGYEVVMQDADAGGQRPSEAMKALGEQKTHFTEKAKVAFAAEKERQHFGGPLDQLGTPTKSDGAEHPKSAGWTSFMTRR